MGKTTIKSRPDGPYEVTGDIDVVDAKGNTKSFSGQQVSLCRCGQSKNKPYCDGSHKTCGFKDP